MSLKTWNLTDRKTRYWERSWEWKQGKWAVGKEVLQGGMSQGVEFGTGYPTGRKEEREAGRFRLLQPGESDEVGLEIELGPLS